VFGWSYAKLNVRFCAVAAVNHPLAAMATMTPSSALRTQLRIFMLRLLLVFTAADLASVGAALRAER